METAKPIAIQPHNRASQLDVAELAGVSQAAVSRAFTPGASISSEVRERVMAAAQTLGYRPNAIARSLIKNSTRIIGIVVVRFANPFYWQVFEAFTQKLQNLGYWTMLLNAGQDQSVDDTLPMALQYQVDGLIITSATLSSTMAAEVTRSGTPVVMFNRYELESQANAVCCDNVGGGQMVAERLWAAGYRRLAYIAGEEGSSTNRDREQGFTRHLQERGYGLPLRESGGEYSHEAGYTATQRLLQSDSPPDAIFCASDLTAMGAVDAASEAGVKVPDQLGIVGFDDIEMTAWPGYAITTVKQPLDQMVDTTIEVLLNAIENPEAEIVMKRMPPTLVERGTTRNV